jgi:YidC/Oxa1 family membrane protein insertase
LHLLLASSILDPIVNVLAQCVLMINSGIATITHNPAGQMGVALVVLALALRLLLWPLQTQQFKSMMAMQKVAPQLKALQAKYKEDPQRLNQETMALYKNNKVNPLAGCLPLLAQMPILFSVYYVVIMHKDLYATTNFLWIGPTFAAMLPKLFNVPIIGASLAQPDLILIAIYMISQYISMRFTTMPATDPAQAQQMKMMQIISPLMIGFFGFRAQWPSAMVLYWLAANLFMMGQQLFLLRRYHEPFSFIDSEHAVTEGLPVTNGKPAKALSPASTSSNGASKPSGNKLKKKNRK